MARPRAFDEDQAILAAQDCFRLHGYAGTSVQDLCAATGLGKGSLYGAFQDKHQLYLRAFERYCAATTAGLRTALTGPEPQAFERLTAHIRQIADSTAGDLQGCFLANGTSERAESDPAVTELARATLDSYEELLTACITQAQRHGEIDSGQDPAALAALVLSVLRGLEALGKAGRSQPFMQNAADTTVAMLAARPH